MKLMIREMCYEYSIIVKIIYGKRNSNLIDQEKVKYRAPKGIMKPSDIQTLKDNKNEIITYLNSKTKLKHDENRYKDS